jgi:hypothetical protein
MPHATDSAFTLLYGAAVIAERAFHGVIFCFFVPAGFVHDRFQTKYCR